MRRGRLDYALFEDSYGRVVAVPERCSLRERVYPEIAFGGFSSIDPKVAFYVRVHALLRSSFVVLDAGCGRGCHAEDPVSFRRDLVTFRGKCRRVIGIDVAPSSSGNPLIDEFRLIRDDRWPLPDASIDLCVSNNVLEHVSDPSAFFSEASRVLKEGAYLCIRTPNAWGYAAMWARLIPNRWHAAVLRALGREVDEKDVFPTRYRCNTVSKMKSMLGRHGLDACVFTGPVEAHALQFNRIAYQLEVWFNRLTPRRFQPALFAFAQKRAAQSQEAAPPTAAEKILRFDEFQPAVPLPRRKAA